MVLSDTTGSDTWPHVTGQSTHKRLFLSTLLYPIPHIHVMSKIFYFSFAPITLPYTFFHIVVAPAVGSHLCGELCVSIAQLCHMEWL